MRKCQSDRQAGSGYEKSEVPILCIFYRIIFKNVTNE